jgi:bacteriocin-like protein
MNEDSKQKELTDEELQQVSGGSTVDLATQQKTAETAGESACAEKIKKVVITW